MKLVSIYADGKKLKHDKEGNYKIPDGTKKLKVNMAEDELKIELGDSGGVETQGYLGNNFLVLTK